jgi:hypothetical protein
MRLLRGIDRLVPPFQGLVVGWTGRPSALRWAGMVLPLRGAGTQEFMTQRREEYKGRPASAGHGAVLDTTLVAGMSWAALSGLFGVDWETQRVAPG